MINRLITLAAMLIIVGPLQSGCATPAARTVGKTAASVLVSDEDENKLGLQVKQEVEKQGVKYIDDPQIVAYVQKITTPITQAANADRKGVQWKLQVIDDPKTVNAFATPGGYIYVYSGLILAADNESEVAGVLSHEAGHVSARHSARQMVNAYGLEAVLGMALGKNPGMVSQIAASIVGNGAMLAHSRSDETEADELGAKYATKVGYNPNGLVTFFQKLLAQQGKTPKVLTWLSTHPATEDRIAHVTQFIKEKGYTGNVTDTPEFQQIKAKLQARPAPAATTPPK
jgi:predicted Zn-dependent protease